MPAQAGRGYTISAGQSSQAPVTQHVLTITYLVLILYILLVHLYFMNFNYSLTSLPTEKKSPACTHRSIEIFLLCWSLAAGHSCLELPQLPFPQGSRLALL